jgi:hypothetical protein
LQSILDLTPKYVYAGCGRLKTVILLPMETLLRLPESASPTTITQVLCALRKEYLTPRHEAKTWGDWIYLECYDTVISIQSNSGLSNSATIEHGEGEEDGEPIDSILRAFGRLGWRGVDDDGEYPLI